MNLLNRHTQLPRASVTRLFQEKGISDFFEACEYVSRIPYGRTSDPNNYYLVLSENKGTCSTKHALLARLAEERNLPISLTLGIFEMDGQNMPETNHVLSSAGLKAIPEAHCYLRLNNKILDFTRVSAPPFASFCNYEQVIAPNQIGDYKINFHREFLRKWIEEKKLNHTLDQIWEIRERCIFALSGASAK